MKLQEQTVASRPSDWSPASWAGQQWAGLILWLSSSWSGTCTWPTPSGPSCCTAARRACWAPCWTRSWEPTCSIRVSAETRIKIKLINEWNLFDPVFTKRLSIRRIRLEHREGGELRVRHDPEDLRETHPGQQRRQPVLLPPHRPLPAGAGVGSVASVRRPPAHRQILTHRNQNLLSFCDIFLTVKKH